VLLFIQENKEEDAKNPNMCVFLHGALKVENMCGIVQVGFLDNYNERHLFENNHGIGYISARRGLVRYSLLLGIRQQEEILPHALHLRTRKASSLRVL